MDKKNSHQDSFAQKVVWITGASAGIGEAMAVAFAASGAKLVLSARNSLDLERVKARCLEAGADQQDVLVVTLDVVDLDAMPGAVDRVMDAFARIDLLINNAGVGVRDFCADINLDVYRTALEVNLIGPIALTKQVLPIMISQGSGHIAGTSSVAGKVGVPLRTAYCAAKFGLIGFLDALRAEVAYHGIKVSTIIPGLVKTGAVANAMTGDGSVIGAEDGVMTEGLTADEAAAAILPELAKFSDEFVIGNCDSSKMVEMKRNNQTQIFRGLEQMAASLHE
ncbi:MAG: SDR family NAD(P)-dependent oxidoreductase [Luminiphilus sp.]|tara:strand:- start:4593 stop:5432 length:840 start_codon:yes stop_codon:yes gene_type:complete